MADRDEDKQAVRYVENRRNSEPIQGEELLQSEELKRKLRCLPTSGFAAITSNPLRISLQSTFKERLALHPRSEK